MDSVNLSQLYCPHPATRSVWVIVSEIQGVFYFEECKICIFCSSIVGYSGAVVLDCGRNEQKD